MRARLANRPLFLKNFWADDHLQFDSAGKPVQHYRSGTFTESAFNFISLKLKKDSLVIHGQRVGLEFSPTGQIKRVPLSWANYDGAIEITVSGQPGSDFGPALDQIFAADFSAIEHSLPPYWTPALAWIRPDTTAQPDPAQGGTGAVPPAQGRKPGENPIHSAGMKPPVLVKNVDPQFSRVARMLHYSGEVEVSLVVDETGKVTDVAVTRPAGLGHDEQALAAVSQYKFAPAQQDGQPVKTKLFVTVAFHMD